MLTAKASRTLKPGVCLLLISVVAGSLLCAVPATGQAADDYKQKKQHALDLYRQNRMVEAASALQQLAAVNDKDTEVFSALGFTLYAAIAAAQNDQEREQLAARARAALTRAKELGDNSTLTDMALSKLQSGAPLVSKFSKNPEADLAMQQAEVDFVKGEMDPAIELYKKALEMDPKLYDAALYIGDAYYKSPDRMSQAPEWFAKAIAINPDRETAYRYWADVLVRQGDAAAAREKYVEAYICEPSNRLAVSGFTTWAKAQHVTLAHPAVTIPTNVSKGGDGKTTITIDPSALGKKKEDGSSAWIVYGVTRAAWSSGKFLREYPNEKTYRHSLKEEAEAVRTVLSAIDARTKKSNELDPSLATLLKLDLQGVLEAYILLARSDEGISQDYPAYLRDHRDRLRAYVVDWVLQGGNPK